MPRLPLIIAALVTWSSWMLLLAAAHAAEAGGANTSSNSSNSNTSDTTSTTAAAGSMDAAMALRHSCSACPQGCTSWHTQKSKCTKFSYGLGIAGLWTACDARYIKRGLTCVQRCDSVYVNCRPLVDCGPRSPAECAVDGDWCGLTALSIVGPLAASVAGLRSDVSADALRGVFDALGATVQQARDLPETLGDNTCPH